MKNRDLNITLIINSKYYISETELFREWVPSEYCMRGYRVPNYGLTFKIVPLYTSQQKHVVSQFGLVSPVPTYDTCVVSLQKQNPLLDALWGERWGTNLINNYLSVIIDYPFLIKG